MNTQDQKPETIRTFIALKLSDAALEHLKETVIPLKKSLHAKEDIRWVPPRNYHITLAFLGNIPVADIPKIETAMALRSRGPRARETLDHPR